MKLFNIVNGPTLTFWVDMGNHLWQSTLFGLFIVLVILFLNNASANTRYIVGWIGLIKFILPSALLYQAGQSLQLSFFNKEFWNIEGLIPFNPQFTEPLFLFNKTDSLLVEPVSITTVSPYSGITLLNILGFIWLVGALLIFVRWQYQLHNLKRELLTQSRPANESLNTLLKQLRVKINLKNNVSALLIDKKIEPGVLGVFTSKLILPDYLVKNLSAKELEPILIHELAHAKRRDNLWGFLQMVLFCLLWFNPLIWWLNRRLTWESERSCDETVLIQSKDKNNYAKGIIMVSHYCIGLKTPGFSGINDIRLENRLESIIRFNGNKLFSRFTHRFIIVTALFFLFLTTSTSGFLAHLGALNIHEDSNTAKDVIAAAEGDSINEVINNREAVLPDEKAFNAVNNSHEVIPMAKEERSNESHSGYVEIAPESTLKITDSDPPQSIEVEDYTSLPDSVKIPFFNASTTSTLNKLFRPLQVAQTTGGDKTDRIYEREYPTSYEEEVDINIADYPDLEIKNKVIPRFPRSVLDLGYDKGFAKIVFIVDEAGQQRDFVITSTSHPDFGMELLKALRKWKFSPIYVKRKPQTTRIKLEANFKFRGISNDDINIIEEAQLRFERVKPIYRINNLSELDREPRLLKEVPPFFPEKMKRRNKNGRVLVEFFIDPNGNVLAPGIKSATNDDFAIAVLSAVQKWKFEPPMKNGIPVSAHVFQHFNFSYVPVKKNKNR